MSRIGRMPIKLPPGVQVEVRSGEAYVEGPKGQLLVPIDLDLRVEIVEGEMRVLRPTNGRRHRSVHGLTRSLLNNAVEGVSRGYVRELEIRGIGYRAKLSGGKIELSIGFSHPVMMEPPEGVSFEVPEPTRLRVIGIDKQLVGQAAANLRAARPPDAYHGKGVRYVGEVVRLKPGKAGTTK